MSRKYHRPHKKRGQTRYGNGRRNEVKKLYAKNTAGCAGQRKFLRHRNG